MRDTRKKKKAKVTHWQCACGRLFHTDIESTRRKCECGRYMKYITMYEVKKIRLQRRGHLLNKNRVGPESV